MSIRGKKAKIPGKTQKNNLLKTKSVLNIKISAKGAQFSHLACQGRRLALMPPSVTPLLLWKEVGKLQ